MGPDAGDKPSGGALELRADPGTALRFYGLLFAVSSLGVAACVIMLAGAAARSLGMLAVQILVLEAPVHFGLAGVFCDFYRGEKSRRWVADGNGVRLFGGGTEPEFVSWGEVSRILMEGHYIGLMKGTEAEPRKIFFVAREERERFYRLYLFKNVYPISDPLGEPPPRLRRHSPADADAAREGKPT